MTDETLPNGYIRETWISDIAERIAVLDAELEESDDESKRLSISHELHERQHQLERRRRYLAEVEEDES